MKVTDVLLDTLREAPWNPNEADEASMRRLAASVGRFGTVLPLVVRPFGDVYEVIGGNQRLRLYREQGVTVVPCVVVDLDEVQAKLLAQGLNAIHGVDDVNRKAALVKDLLARLPEDEVSAILPDSLEALRSLAHLGDQLGSLASGLGNWQGREGARLERVSFPFTPDQREVVEEAIARALPQVQATEEPNRRALALVEVCRGWMLAGDVQPVVSAEATQQAPEGDLP
jgi:ParB family chromosome partitioning protein